MEQREYAWCVEKGFHTEVGSKKSVPEHYPVNKALKRIHLGFENRSFVEFDFLVACESGKGDLACSRNFMLTGKAPQCTQLVTDKDNDGVCDKLDECMWDPNDEKDSSTGTCVINTDVRNIDGAYLCIYIFAELSIPAFVTTFSGIQTVLCWLFCSALLFRNKI